MNKKIEICFISSNPDLNNGSYRIWVRDLATYMNQLNIKAHINRMPKNIKSNLVIILRKSDVTKIDDFKKKYPKNLIGIINPTVGIFYNADFIIVGSLEEKDSLSLNKNVFIFPLIENQYRKINQKKHLDKDKLIIGMHGSYSHLSKFNSNLKEALEEFSEKFEIELRIITNQMPTRWTYGRPKISKIKILNFNLNTFSRDLLKCDIGLVPNISDNTPLFKKTSNIKGLYSSDYFFRIKNKSNSGRMFVFIQHGIPVIADLTPSNIKSGLVNEFIASVTSG